MKHYLLAGMLLAATPALAQTTPPAGQEAAAPFKKANTLISHTFDSLSTACGKLAGVSLITDYTIDRNDKEHLLRQSPAPRIVNVTLGLGSLTLHSDPS